MILLKKLHIKNFMSIDTLDMEFEGKQITAITGQNGSGKSSLLYAIAFAITGFRKGETLKDYVKTGTDSATIHMEAILKGKPIIYDISITGAKKKSITTSREVVYDGKTYINSEYNEFISTYGLEDVESLMFMFQGMNNIVNAKPIERANLLKKLFNFEFPDIVMQLKEDMSAFKTDNIKKEALKEELESQKYEELPLTREIPEQAITEWENRLEEIKALLVSLGDVDKDSLDKCQREISMNNMDISSAQGNLTRDKSRLESLKREESRLQETVDSTNISELNERVELYQKQKDEHALIYEEKSKKYRELYSDLNVLKHNLSELENHYNISKNGGVCHSCGQPIDKDYLSNLIKDIDTAKVEVSNKEKEIKELDYDSTDSEGTYLSKMLLNATTSVNDYNYTLSQLEHVRREINALTDGITSSNNNYNLLIEKKERLQNDWVSLQGKMELLDKKDKLLQEQKSLQEEINYARETHAKNLERYEYNKKIVESKKDRDNRVEELSHSINNLALDMDKVKQKIDIFDSKFPNYIVLQACKQLEDIINEIVQRVFPYFKVSLKLSKGGVNFFFTSESSDTDWIPVTMASGAQKSILNLAYFVALARLNNVSCIFLDEIDASMSAENAGLIYEFVSTIDYFDQVFFISHRKEAYEVVKSKNDNLVTYIVDKGEYAEI